MLKSKILFFVSALSISLSPLAAPNVWRSGSAQGFTEYSIQDHQGQLLWITCNEAAGDEFDHSVRFQNKTLSYENTDEKYPLTFILDGLEATPPGTTKWREGANAWHDFTQGIAKAKKIDVFINNKRITTFTPTVQSIQTIAKDISSCEATW